MKFDEVELGAIDTLLMLHLTIETMQDDCALVLELASPRSGWIRDQEQQRIDHAARRRRLVRCGLGFRDRRTRSLRSRDLL
ncbi:MAG TPA: hypothetical protein VFC19_09025 [Candidatus Limnocylindrales bacterium]|nr:hypothetical protein [Candidatus Limnocylindrales bacterium]